MIIIGSVKSKDKDNNVEITIEESSYSGEGSFSNFLSQGESIFLNFKQISVSVGDYLAIRVEDNLRNLLEVFKFLDSPEVNFQRTL